MKGYKKKCQLCEKKSTCLSCPHCQVHYCVPCMKSYLMKSIQMPHCHECRIEWIEVLSMLSVSFQKKYKKRMEHILFLQEQTKLYPLQPFALYEIKTDQIGNEIKNILLQIKENKLNEDQMVRVQRDIDRVLKRDLLSCYRTNTIIRNQEIRVCDTIPISHCTNSTCRGFISPFYKCGICKVQVCPICVKKHNDNEECIPESKSCPYCKKMVFKTKEDTTFCFQCHLGFSWENGKEDLIQPHIVELINISSRPVYNIYFLQEKATRYSLHIRHLRRFILEQYTEIKDIRNERIRYMEGKSLSIKKKCAEIVFSSKRNKLEQRIVATFIEKGEILLSRFSECRETNQSILDQLDQLSEKSIQEVEELDKTYGCKGIVLKKYFTCNDN